MLSRSSSISSTSGFVTPQSSVFSLPLVDDDHHSPGLAALETSRSHTPDVEPLLKEIEVKDDSDSTETEVMSGRTYGKEAPSPASTANIFLERLSNSSRSSLNGSDHMEEDLAELGIYDSELLAEDAVTGSESEDDDGWEERDMGHQGEASAMIGMQAGGRGRRKKKKWKEAEEELQRGGNRSLAELVAPIILAHPLALLPLIPLLPYSFLPAGVVLFIPIFVVTAGLSACAHVVVVYLSRYLKVITFEDMLYRATGRNGLLGGRAVQLTGILLISSAWLRSVHAILLPVLQTIAPTSHFFQSRLLWTILSSILMWPSSFSFFRHSHVVARLPEYLVILVPMVIFLVIGRTTEIVKAGGLATPVELLLGSESATDVTLIEARTELLQRPDISTSLVNAGTAITLITLFFTPHIRTLPIHSTLMKTSRRWFPSSCLSASGILVTLCLPFALVPYYLLAKEPSSSMPSLGQAGQLAGIFEALQVGNTVTDADPGSNKGFRTDSWLNFARVCMVVLILHSVVLWVAHAKDISLRALGIRREGRAKAQRWLSVCFWVLVTGIACIGGRFADRLAWIGAACVISVGWLIPAIVFIKTFHVANPLSIVFPAGNNPYQAVPDTAAGTPFNEDAPGETVAPGGQGMMRDPSIDVLLARKERQLQKRRTGRRMWQDLIVFLGILPMGIFTVFWCIGVAIGLIPA